MAIATIQQERSKVSGETETRPAVACDGLAAIPVDAPTRAVGNKQALEGVRICHFLFARTLDSRSFHLQSVSMAARGLRLSLIAPHGINTLEEGVELVSFRGSTNRLLRILMVPLILWRLLARHADIYQFHDPELLPAALLLKLAFRKKVIYDTCEDFPSMMLTKPWIPRALRSLVAKTVSCIEWLGARWLDGILTADSGTMRRFAKVGESKKYVFYGFPKLDLFPEPERTEKEFDVIYRGGLSHRAGTFVLLNAIGKLLKEGKAVRLLLIGYFDDARVEQLVRNRIRVLGLQEAVELRGIIDHRKMAEVLSEARIGVCPLQPIPKFLHNIPMKVWEYWACGLPVIASELPPIRPFFRDSSGILVKPGDVVELAAAIRRLLENPKEAEQMGAQGRRAVVERLNNESQAHGLLSFYSRILR